MIYHCVMLSHVSVPRYVTSFVSVSGMIPFPFPRILVSAMTVNFAIPHIFYIDNAFLYIDLALQSRLGFEKNLIIVAAIRQ